MFGDLGGPDFQDQAWGKLRVRRRDQLGVTRLMGVVGTSADNAACESFHASLKRETLHGAHDYGDADTRRQHAANGHRSPNAYGHRHHTVKLMLVA
ncbi:hypothetical protein ABZY31_24350 [Streptomyces sp. NPDC006529]|uniref:hypothetical protein n=1 Tax=Streptomyces sp. NPDC006529 TaxID=3157177 RepID=UPI0033AFCFD0